jgi:hypothetical protein
VTRNIGLDLGVGKGVGSIGSRVVIIIRAIGVTEVSIGSHVIRARVRSLMLNGQSQQGAIGKMRR